MAITYSLTGTISNNSSFNYLKNGVGLTTAVACNPTKNFSTSLASGDVSKIFTDSRTITGSETLDCTSLVDAFAQTLNFATVKHVFLVNTDTANAITFGGGTAPLFAAMQAVATGGAIALRTPITV